MLFHMRTGLIGLNKLLHAWKLKYSPDCPCGAKQQHTVKHHLMFCPDLHEPRMELKKMVGPLVFEQLMSDPKKTAFAAKWATRHFGISPQFDVARKTRPVYPVWLTSKAAKAAAATSSAPQLPPAKVQPTKTGTAMEVDPQSSMDIETSLSSTPITTSTSTSPSAMPDTSSTTTMALASTPLRTD